MGGLQKQHFIAAAIATALVVNFAYFGGIKMLGAHPWWASKVGYIGAGVGAIVWFALSIAKLNHKTILFISGGCLTVSVLIAHYGKGRFVAAEDIDVVAGQLWYFGWIGTVAAALVLFATQINRR